MASQRYTYDSTGLLKAYGLVAASAAEAKIYDAGQARLDSIAVVDVSAIETGTGDEHYEIYIQGSTDSAFGSDVVNLATLQLGHVSTLHGGVSAAPGTGRYAVQVWNEFNGKLYRYIRVYTYVAGTIATGVNFQVFLATDDI